MAGFLRKIFNSVANGKSLMTNIQVKDEVEYSLCPIKVPINYKPISYSSDVSLRLMGIVQKIEFMRDYYKHYVDLSFNDPCSNEVIKVFESENKITFPDEYKEFISVVGTNNGPGCAGIFSPIEKPQIMLKGFNNYDKISEEFQYNDEYTDRIIRSLLNGQPVYSCTEISGCFIICDHDMGFYDLLVINGEQKGKVWSYLDGHLVPKYIQIENAYTQVSFYDWIENWLKNLDIEKKLDWSTKNYIKDY